MCSGLLADQCIPGLMRDHGTEVVAVPGLYFGIPLIPNAMDDYPVFRLP